MCADIPMLRILSAGSTSYKDNNVPNNETGLSEHFMYILCTVPKYQRRIGSELTAPRLDTILVLAIALSKTMTINNYYVALLIIFIIYYSILFIKFYCISMTCTAY